VEDRGKGRVHVFLDEKDIEGGQSIPDSVRKNIAQCDEFVVLLSRYSKDRPWVLMEIGGAWVLRKTIIAIIDKIGPKEMPDIILPFKAVDLNDFDQYVSQLMKRVNAGGKK
jgi:TIR domain